MTVFHPLRRAVPLWTAVALAVACSKSPSADGAGGAAGAGGASGGTAAASGGAATKAPSPGGGGAGGSGGAGGPGGPGGRGGARAVLSAADVATIRAGRIEATTPIAGDLRPLETISIRSRLEADIEAVLVRDGERVRAGQLLARLDAGELDAARRSAEADRASAQAELSTAQWNADQAAELFKAGAIAEGDLRTRRQAVDGAKARVAAAEARYRTADRDFSSTRVVAPATGTVERRFVQPGERVLRGAQLFSVVRSEQLELAAAVPARAATGVRPGQLARFAADGREFTGRVARVSATIDPASRAVTVYVQVPNADGSLKGNSFANGRIVQRVIDNALLVPTAALRQSPDNGAPYVYRIEGDQIGSAKVGLGVVDDAGGMAEVVDGLAAGDRVIVGNVGTLGRGMKVTVVGEKPAARAGGAAGASAAPAAGGERRPTGR
ncbi:MAG: efflux RND transporter periplasmic adaptor subunit [Gemmatimonadaceae bacterium]|nr:efflux RND transporter periplasmic adaptor subunit [Gemmatimonadaceae bacterium]